MPHQPMKAGFEAPKVAQFPSAGANTEMHALHHARNNHDWFWFESPALKKDTRVFGQIKVKLWSTVGRKWVTMTPTIADVDATCHQQAAGQHVSSPSCLTDPAPARHLHAVTRGWLDSRYRNGLGKQVDVTPGQPFGSTIVEKPQDYVFKKGHHIGLMIQTEINEWSLPKPYAGCDTTDQSCAYFKINWEDGKTRVILPVVNAPKDPMDMFDSSHHH
jgi:predicted acyl esterase